MTHPCEGAIASGFCSKPPGDAVEAAKYRVFEGWDHCVRFDRSSPAHATRPRKRLFSSGIKPLSMTASQRWRE